MTLRPNLGQRVLQYFANSKMLSDKRRMELYPPFFLMRIKALEISEDWRKMRFLLPLNTLSRNPGGVMFGGYQAALADPIAALACAKVFPGYSHWTRSMSIDFRVGGSTDLELRFELPEVQEEVIREQLQCEGRATPTFTYGFYLTDGTQCTQIANTVAIRPRGYVKATTPPADTQEL